MREMVKSANYYLQQLSDEQIFELMGVVGCFKVDPKYNHLNRNLKNKYLVLDDDPKFVREFGINDYQFLSYNKKEDKENMFYHDTLYVKAMYKTLKKYGLDAIGYKINSRIYYLKLKQAYDKKFEADKAKLEKKDRKVKLKKLIYNKELIDRRFSSVFEAIKNINNQME